MFLTPDNRLKNVLVIGDKVLVKPLKPEEKTSSGLYLPPGVFQQEKVQKGYVVKVGPGYALPGSLEDEPWKQEETVKYLSLQVREGDLAVFLVNQAIELKYEEEKYFIMPHNAILLVERDDDF